MNQFSLCIPTHNRFDTFLKINLDKYLTNKYITEIIIYDDATSDYDKLITEYGLSHQKIKVFKQDKNVGPFKNKVDCCSLASNDWICLIDSDNFADINYFESLLQYWNMHGQNEHIIYTPTKALPVFNFTDEKLPSYITKDVWNLEYKNNNIHNTWPVNLGNCVFHKNLVQYLKLEKYHKIFPYVDALYINWIALNHGYSIKFVNNMQYAHTIHQGSTYLNTSSQQQHFCNTFDWFIS